jgi:uncharacterized protein YmfQ (DUF2313 family)
VTLSSVFSYELLPVGEADVEGSPGTWRVKLGDGTDFLWRGFYTGPAALNREDLERVCRDLLGIGLDEVPLAAGRELRPYVSDGTAVHSIIMYSATPVLKSLQADMDDVLNGQRPDDVTTYVETREVVLAGEHDLVVGRTSTWRAAAILAGVEMVDVPGIEYYYLSHAILRLAADQGVDAPALRRLIDELRARPDTLIRVYSLDRETQIVLLYLKRMAGLDVLHTDANSPEVAEYWNTKAPLHPTVEDAAELGPPELGPPELGPPELGSPERALAAESTLSPLRRRLNVSCAVVPGYVVDGKAPDSATVATRLARAAGLLRERYGISRGCLKPSESGAGARIVPGIDLYDAAKLRELADRIYAAQEEFLLEAHLSYLSHQVGGLRIVLAPSVHIRHGHLTPGMTLQITNGTSWQGNVYIDEAVCESVGISLSQYRAIRADLAALHSGFGQAQLSVVTGGFDFGIGRVGGNFGDRVLVALQDPNLSSHGAEYLRLFLDKVAARGGPRYGATKVIVPVASLADLTKSAERSAPDGWARVISAIPGRWGMLAVAADSPDAAVQLITDWEQKWIANGLILPAAFR